MKDKLLKIVNNEYLDSYSIYELKTAGLIVKITYTQYVITKKGLSLITNYGFPQ